MIRGHIDIKSEETAWMLYDYDVGPPLPPEYDNMGPVGVGDLHYYYE